MELTPVNAGLIAQVVAGTSDAVLVIDQNQRIVYANPGATVIYDVKSTRNLKPWIERHGGVVVMTYGTLLGSAPVVLVSLPAGLQVHWAEVPPLIWLGMLYAVLISAFLGWLVWGWVNAVRGVARTAPLMYLMPPVAALVAWLVTGERYTAIKLLGAAITLVGVAWAQFASAGTRDAVRDSVPPVD